MNSRSEQVTRHAEIKFLYLDNSVCDRCVGTEQNLDKALQNIGGPLAEAGVSMRVEKIQVVSEGQARELGFVTSPTVVVNGYDIHPDIVESSCKSCGELCADDVSCRVWRWRGKEYTVAPLGLIIDGVLSGIYGVAEKTSVKRSEGSRANLRRFFDGARQEEAGDSTNSCTCGAC